MSKIKRILSAEGLVREAGVRSDLGRALVAFLRQESENGFRNIPSLRSLQGNAFAYSPDGLMEKEGWDQIQAELEKGLREVLKNSESLMDELYPDGYADG